MNGVWAPGLVYESKLMVMESELLGLVYRALRLFYLAEHSAEHEGGEISWRRTAGFELSDDLCSITIQHK